MSDLLELTGRIENLAYPCRATDLELWWLLVAHDGIPAAPMPDDYRLPNLKMNDCPRYTASVDAALTLVKKCKHVEWELSCCDVARDPRFGRFQARIKLLSYEDDPEELGPQAITSADSPALALCGAALRAKAASHD